MKRFILLFVFLSFFLLFPSCKRALKDIKDYYPTVVTLSAVAQLDGSLKVVGNTTSEGNSKILYQGVCMDIIPEPKMSENQIIAESTGKIFSVLYLGLKKKKKYYFRTWAANDDGYSYGNTISIDSFFVTPIIPPCNPGSNYLNTGSIFGIYTINTIDKPTFNSTTWDFTALSWSGADIRFHFYSEPTTGIYSTTYDIIPLTPTNQVTIEFITNTTSLETLDPGTSVYVNDIASNKFTVTICDALWTGGSGHEYHLVTQFTASH